MGYPFSGNYDINLPHSKANLNQSADSNEYNAPIPKYTIVWD
jgi:hypothetical protein